MRKEVLTWLGKEFLFPSSEAKPRANATEETREIFQRFQNELQHTGLSLDNTVQNSPMG